MTLARADQILYRGDDSYISRSKVSQTMKFGRILEQSMGNIFLEKPTAKCGRRTKLVSEPFIKN